MAGIQDRHLALGVGQAHLLREVRQAAQNQEVDDEGDLVGRTLMAGGDVIAIDAVADR